MSPCSVPSQWSRSPADGLSRAWHFRNSRALSGNLARSARLADSHGPVKQKICARCDFFLFGGLARILQATLAWPQKKANDIKGLAGGRGPPLSP